MAGKLTLQELERAVKTGKVDTVLAVQVDMQGRLMGKRFQAEFFLESAVTETHSCNYLLSTDMEMETVPGYANASWSAGYGDYAMRPDLNTLRLIPWLEGTALVLCDLYDHKTHEEVKISPRAILKRQIARLADMGFTPMMATELEFFVFKNSFEEAHEQGYRHLDLISPYNEDYHIFQTTKEEDLMRAIRTGLNGADIPIENTKGEASAGQAEVNVRYADALSMADRHAIVKNGVKEIAWAKQRAVTFMAKWDNASSGSSSHIHQSLWTPDGKSAFFDPEGQYGMSQTMRHYMAGLLHHAPAMTLFLAPYVNSYKRFVEGTFAPTKTVWSLDNRTAGFRVCGDASSAVRVECRIGGSDLNPYLALASQIAAGIDGIVNKRELPEEFEGDAYQGEDVPEIPTNISDATAELDKSAMYRDAFGNEVVEHYLHAARWEQLEYNRRVTDWDLARGFERA
ncbi:MAG: glutamine synthetase [Parvibaculaceae bacterium]|jgi:glutamine synthetase